jgi:hypothetical protein
MTPLRGATLNTSQSLPTELSNLDVPEVLRLY